MLRPIVSALLAASLLTGSAAQAEPRMVYTRHSLKIDVRDLDLSRAGDQRILQARIANATDEVCGGRPDRGNRYTKEELTRMLPAYDQCRAEAMQRVQASLNLPAMVAQSAGP